MQTRQYAKIIEGRVGATDRAVDVLKLERTRSGSEWYSTANTLRAFRLCYNTEVDARSTTPIQLFFETAQGHC
jgi:hypothetical protein